jgi:drug/metabolite transporter (DMT)-like permease
MVLPDRESKGRGIPIQLYLPPVYWTATLVLLAVCLVKGVPLAGFSTNSWIALGLLGLGPTVVGHSLFNWGSRYLPAFLVNTAVVLEPIGASLLVFWIFGEEPSTGLFFGAPLMIAALFLVFLRPPHEGAA